MKTIYQVIALIIVLGLTFLQTEARIFNPGSSGASATPIFSSATIGTSTLASGGLFIVGTSTPGLSVFNNGYTIVGGNGGQIPLQPFTVSDILKKGIELIPGTNGIIQAIDRTGSSYLTLALHGLNVLIQPSGSSTQQWAFGVGGATTTQNLSAGSVQVSNDAYASAWNGSTTVATKDAVYDRFESSPMVLVASSSVSAVTSTTFSGLATSTRYMVRWKVLQNTSGGMMRVRFNGDTGTNYFVAQHSSQSSGAAAATFGDEVATSTPLTYSNQTISASQAGQGEFEFTHERDTTTVLLISKSTYITSGPDLVIADGAGYYDGASDISSLTFFTSAGTYTGTFFLYRLGG